MSTCLTFDPEEAHRSPPHSKLVLGKCTSNTSPLPRIKLSHTSFSFSSSLYSVPSARLISNLTSARPRASKRSVSFPITSCRFPVTPQFWLFQSYTLWGVLLLLDCLLACLRPLFSSSPFSSRGFWTFLGQRDVLDDQPHDVLVGDNLAHVDAGMLLTSQLHLSLARPLLPPHVPDCLD